MKVGDLVKVAKKHSQPATVGLIVKLKEDGVFGGVHHALVKPVDNESNRLLYAMPEDVEVISESR
tara:strand:+ start:228 stop:422 length:195 start_codon:yes stop_codon:yes gene_type:complete